MYLCICPRVGRSREAEVRPDRVTGLRGVWVLEWGERESEREHARRERGDACMSSWMYFWTHMLWWSLWPHPRYSRLYCSQSLPLARLEADLREAASLQSVQSASAGQSLAGWFPGGGSPSSSSVLSCYSLGASTLPQLGQCPAAPTNGHVSTVDVAGGPREKQRQRMETSWIGTREWTGEHSFIHPSSWE